MAALMPRARLTEHGGYCAPSMPTGLTATAVSSLQITSPGPASTDNVGVTGYRIFADLRLPAQRPQTAIRTPAYAVDSL